MTERYPMRLGLQCGVVRPWAEHGLPLDEQTLPDLLREIGYRTAIVGKWHLGHASRDYLPTARGFDQQYGHYNGALDYFTHIRDGGFDWHENAAVNRDKGYATDLIADAAIASSEAQAEELWTLRDSISAAERALGPAMQHDISVPVERMPEFILAATPSIETAHPGTRVAAFGHLGDGNVHFHVLAPPGAVPGEWEESTGKQVSAEVYDLVTQWGGSISAEHGIGQMKVGELGRLGDPVALAIMRSVKAALAPDGLLNPGKLVPPRPH